MNLAVLGIGNVLVGDDAAGPSVVTLLDALWEFPEGVVVEDIGTPSLDLAARLSDFETVIFVDAVSVKADPGTIRVFSRDEILKNPPGLRISPHDPSLKETLLTVEFLGTGPKEIVLVGIVPESAHGFGMSDAVKKAIPQAVETVLRELEFRDITPQPRREPRATEGWWSAAVPAAV
jgi:hydrogenase maturation protease